MNLTATPFKSTSARRRAFSLIELLVVVAVIAVLASFTVYGLTAIGKKKKINTAQAEMSELQTAIANYYAHYHVYPPGNGLNTASSATINPLYYELTGVTIVTNAGVVNYQAVDNSLIPVGGFTNAFNSAGILNCTRGGGEDAVVAVNYLGGLKPNRVMTANVNGNNVNLLVTSVGGPDDAYLPAADLKGVNPFRYKSPSPTNNNADSYDLWIQLSLGATNYGNPGNSANLRLISNWSKTVQSKSPMP